MTQPFCRHEFVVDTVPHPVHGKRRPVMVTRDRCRKCGAALCGHQFRPGQKCLREYNHQGEHGNSFHSAGVPAGATGTG